MSDVVILAIIAAVVQLAGTVATLIVVLRTGRKVAEVAHQTNSMTEVLTEQARAAGFEAGRGAVRRGDRSST